MAPKTAVAKPSAAKKASAAPEHPPYKEMIKESIRAVRISTPFSTVLSRDPILGQQEEKKKRKKIKIKRLIANVVIEFSSKNVMVLGLFTRSPTSHVIFRHCILQLALLQRVVMILTNSRFSRPALKKYIQANYKGVGTDRFDQLFNQALKKGAENGEFAFPKGMLNIVCVIVSIMLTFLLRTLWNCQACEEGCCSQGEKACSRHYN